MKPSHEICKPLPSELTKQVNTSETREEFIVDFLKKRLPASDIKGISDELTKTFIFDKVKSRVKKEKPKKKPFLNTRKQKLIGINNDIGNKKGKLKYKDLLPLNKMWLEYILQAIGFKHFKDLPTSSIDQRWEMINQRLMKADYHGAKISVIRSKCPSLIGITGLIVQDTKNTFRVISEDDTIRTIPKPVVAIKIHLLGASLELFGKEFCIRPAERAVKKFKANHIAEL
ncbi:hypothetical protein PV328_003553 [Microctonus aethiopoides]|uniref:Ribonuclease P protein subunit p29 n=1 Tax=Microctonus aethiopoides TaxID=144406 RepID=A0AA39KKM3_9HYME|nr:hypothetical protein PV328_003553 [Microctonus aethiopoides]